VTVDELIDRLRNLPQRSNEVRMMIDCPHCGRSSELTTLDEVVVIGSKEPEEKTK
jgi:glycosylphosphatidylinositol transamidase (GPIT) subunit GPI8